MEGSCLEAAFLFPSLVVEQMFPDLPVENLRAFLRTNSHHLILDLERLCIPYWPHIPEGKLAAQKSYRTCLRPHAPRLAMALGSHIPFLSPIISQQLNHSKVLPYWRGAWRKGYRSP